MKYTDIVKHAKKITKAKHLNALPVLKGMYMDDNKIYATDKHRLFSINHTHQYNNTVMDLKNESVTTDHNYPNVNRILENKDYTIQSELTHTDVTQAIILLKAITSLKVKLVELNTSENHILISSYSREHKNIQIPFKLKISESFTDKSFKTYVNAKYLLEMFEFIKDTNDDTNYLYFNTPFTALRSSSKNEDFNYILLPVRIDKEI